MAKRFIYTARGDDGTTGLISQKRYLKADLRFEVLGSIDECSAMIGLAKTTVEDDRMKVVLTDVQRDLYHIMGDVSYASDKKGDCTFLPQERILWLEEVIEQFSSDINSPGGFILPGDTKEDAVLDLTRTTIRRAERRLVELLDVEQIECPSARQYFNRLSSLIYTLELYVRSSMGKDKPTLAKTDKQ